MLSSPHTSVNDLTQCQLHKQCQVDIGHCCAYKLDSMLRGMLRAANGDQLDQIHRGILEVLERVGLRIKSRILLEALAGAGCKVDWPTWRVWFRPELVEQQVSAQKQRCRSVRSSLWYPFCSQMQGDDVSWPDTFICDYGYGTPWIYDYQAGGVRQPTVKDQIDMILLGNALECVRAVNAPLICSEFDPRTETIESARVLLRHTRKPGWVGTNSRREVKYLAELAALADRDFETTRTTQPAIAVTAYCTTTPLKLEERSAGVLEEAFAYGFPINFASMPILGATSPITPAGSAVLAGAELLGCMTAATLVDANAFYYTTSISAEMDMKTTAICFGRPAAMLTDILLHQLFRFRYGLVHNVDPGYVEAKTPGMHACWAKTYRQMAFGSTVSSPLPLGALDNASVFSPTQTMLDLEVNDAHYRFGKGVEVDAESICLDLIQQLEFCERSTYLESDHTLHHLRGVGWYPQSLYATTGESELLTAADHKWRELVASQSPPPLDAAYSEEIDRIVEAAKRELLA